jgi:Ubiquitin family
MPPPIPPRPPLHNNSSSNHNNGSQTSSSQIVPRNNTRRPRRQRYNTIAITDDIDDADGHHDSDRTAFVNDDIEPSVVVTANDDDDEIDIENSSSSRHHRRRRPPLYTAIPTTSATNNTTSPIVMEVTILDFTHKRWPIQLTTENVTSTSTTTNNNSSNDSTNSRTSYEPTVYDLKHVGFTVHNIPILQQRLIYQGKLLNDDSVPLSSLGIQKSGSIVHLFPKPRVIVVDNSNNNSVTAGNNNNNNSSSTHTASSNEGNNENSNNESNGGAHVPVIVMEQSEVDRRSEILVLGHADYIEAVSNVKLFSLMLMIISTIELLHLLSLYITPAQSSGSGSSYYNNNNNNHYGDASNSVPHVQEDDHFFNDDQYNTTTLKNSTTNTNVIDTITAGANSIDPIDRILDQWTPIKYVDLIISILGIYVSILGMRASNENCIRTARYYLIGTTITAIGWLTYNYIISYEIDVEVDAHPEKYYDTTSSSEGSDYSYGSPATTSDDAIGESYSNSGSSSHNNTNESPYNQAFSAMILPGMVWALCIFRAWQFQHVLYDAELEAAQRTNAMMSMDDDPPPDRPETANDRTLGDVELSTMVSGVRNENPSRPVGMMA